VQLLASQSEAGHDEYVGAIGRRNTSGARSFSAEMSLARPATCLLFPEPRLPAQV